ncbi:MAG: cohesin domain-containing protein [Candidatus Parcubacteria bacterium]|nr:cohesin domain-containing protein [Candidatus Parcubacteria bacterium]
MRKLIMSRKAGSSTGGKKFIIFIMSVLVFSLICLPVNAGSATLSLSTAKTSLKVGDVFKVSVNINSGGNDLQVVRAKISYSADLIQAQGFTLGSLFPQKSPGELIGNGTIYSGGYRIGAGTSSNGLLGTATFKVIKEGKATISLIAGSRMITPEPKDIYSGGNSLALTLSAVEKPKEETKPAEADKPAEKIVMIAPDISSATNPENVWSNNNNVILTWNQPANCQGYVLKLAEEPLDDIGNEITTTKNSYTYDNQADGIWIFQLKAKYPTGFSAIANYTIKIDTAAPQAMVPSIEAQKISDKKNSYQIFFNTTDALSGIKSYQIQFDGSPFKEATSPYLLTEAETKTQNVAIKAIDNADNETTAVSPIADYIKQQEAALWQLQQEKITLFDIQANATKRSWLEFYLTIVIIAVVFIIILAWIIMRKRK